MPPLTPAETERLVKTAQDAAQAGHGRKEPIYAAAAAELGRSVGWVKRHLHDVSVRPQRKQRSDSGQHALALGEAQIIAAWVMDGLRKNNKRLRSIRQALQELRYAGMVKAERVDDATGEIVPLSFVAVAAAMRKYGLHPDQLLRPAPAAALRSLHPNHVWEIDASLCVLYYLAGVTGLQVLDADKFYKNKPKALERIQSERVWRYLCVDHYSGSIFCWYVLGAESGANLVDVFIQAVSPRTVLGQQDPFCGVPFIVYVDPGSANTGALAKNLWRRLDVEVLVHEPGNARATGGVEKPQDIWEHVFESTLRSEPVANIDELNEAACIFARFFNATAEHTRHGRTRTDMWLTIAGEHKRVAPAPDLMRLLATHQPEERKVQPWPGPVVEFRGALYDVSAVPGVMIGEKLRVTYSPYLAGHASIVDRDAGGKEVLIAVPEIARDEAGFPANAAVIGEEFRRPADTVLQTNRKAIERLAMGARTDEEAAAARKARRPAFGGEVQPLREARETVLPTPLPKRGTPLVPQVQMPERKEVMLTHFQAAGELARRGLQMTPERNAQVAAWHPDGVPEAELDELQRRLTVRGTLRVVGGGDPA